MAKEIRCPYCKGTAIMPMGQHNKSFSLDKAALGLVTFSWIGFLFAGLLGKKGKHEWFCQDCHKTFKTR